MNSLSLLLLIDDNAPASWNAWLTNFKLSVEMVTLKLGKEKVGRTFKDVFRGRIKLLALLYAIGDHGKDALTNQGFDFLDQNASYDEAMQLLKNVYEKKEHVYVSTMNFVTAYQVCDENECEYLLRVEGLSRKMKFLCDNDDVRQQFAVAIVVNGLREKSLRTELMQVADLTWSRLTEILRAKMSARESAKTIDSVRKEQNVKVSKVELTTPTSSKESDNGSCETFVRNVCANSVSLVSKKHGRSSNIKCGNDFSKGDKLIPEWRRKHPNQSPQRDNTCFGCGRHGHRIRFCSHVLLVK